MEDGERNEKNSKGRRSFLLLSGLAVLYFGFRVFPDFRRADLVFEQIQDPLGFRRLTEGKSSTGFDLFVGLDGPADGNNEHVERRVRQNICDTLYGEARGDNEVVPVASFSDYYCPYCRVQTKRLSDIEARSDNNIRIVWHELPLLGEASTLAAKAAMAAKYQGAYSAYHERLMKSPFQATPEYLRILAEDIGVDHDRLIADMEGERVQIDLENSAALARIFAFVGTPAMVIGRTVIQGEISDRTIQDVIAQERESDWTSVCL